MLCNYFIVIFSTEVKFINKMRVDLVFLIHFGCEKKLCFAPKDICITYITNYPSYYNRMC